MSEAEDVTLDALVEEYGRLREAAGRLLADIGHRMRLQSLLLQPGATVGPLSPEYVPPALAKPPERGHAGRYPTETSAKTLCVEALKEQPNGLNLNDLFQEVTKRGYIGRKASFKSTIYTAVRFGTLEKVGTQFLLPTNGHGMTVDGVGD